MPTDTHARQILASSDNPNWRSPKWLIAALEAEFAIVLDAAADADSAVCLNYLGPGSDLLEDGVCGVPWWTAVAQMDVATSGGARAIFCNPPYSRKLGIAIEPWIAAMAEAGDTGAVIGVIPYAPQTKWWRRYVVGDLGRASEIRLFPYRLKFDPPPDYTGKASGANVNTAVVIWRPSELFLDPWVPHQRYWNPRPLGVKPDGDDEDDT